MSEDKNYQSPLKLIFDNLTKKNATELVYGEPIIEAKQTLVPVAKLRHSFGSGGGSKDEEVGEGGGGHFSVKPVGMHQIKGDKVKFKPVIRFKFSLAAVLAFGLSVILLRQEK